MRALNASFTVALIYGLLGFVITRILMGRLLVPVLGLFRYLP